MMDQSYKKKLRPPKNSRTYYEGGVIPSDQELFQATGRKCSSAVLPSHHCRNRKRSAECVRGQRSKESIHLLSACTAALAEPKNSDNHHRLQLRNPVFPTRQFLPG